MVFLHGTTIMHKTAVGCSREERVKQVIEKDESVEEYNSYVPIGNAVQKLNGWKEQGAVIIYLSSHPDIKSVNDDKSVLKKYDFPSGDFLYRKDGQEYKDVAEDVVPDILIEDDCESIGGAKEMTITFVNPEVKEKIKSIPVKEFGGIDYLPDDFTELKEL